MTNDNESLDADVLIVGYGPVGQTLAALLGARGHRVIVLERRQGRYETPRAGHFDHEIMRIFQSMGIAEKIRRIAEPALRYEFLDADGAVLARLPRDWDAPSRWDASYHFYQPELEEVLDWAVRQIDQVDVRFGQAVTGLRREAGHVVAVLDDGKKVSARYGVGADGANSVVRSTNSFHTEDLGFQADWLVVDIRPFAGATLPNIPDTGQVLNPARPNHMARVGDRYFRWEFMLVDGDDPEEMMKPERVWQLLSRWMTPDQGELIRQTVYTFRSIVADTFRDGPLLLAGDSAHVMPPFLGQGMSSGIRDAATLDWILDLVLTGASDEKLLDLYTATRRPNVLSYIKESVAIGAVICETDPVRAAGRRDAMRAATELPPPFQPLAGAGFVPDDALSGQLAVQPLLQVDGAPAALADYLFGHGFTLFSLVDLDSQSSELASELAAAVGLRVVVLGSGRVQEQGRALTDWLVSAGAVAVLVRPDFYVHGTSPNGSDISRLLLSLTATLALA
jgi:2-polyprenyl-6-methoxyphenol hydroxylase-like FAD-dependent oxidoreductase